RCGEYAKIYTAVKTASTEMAGGQVTYTAPASIFTVGPKQAAPAAAAAGPTVSKDFEFVSALSTIEEFEPMAAPIKQQPGIVEITGSQLTITVKWDPSKVDEAGVCKYLTYAGYSVKYASEGTTMATRIDVLRVAT